MKVEIGKNGVIYCNTVKYNWKQTRNLIADGCSGNMSNCWDFINGVSYTNDPNGYKTYRCFKIASGTPAGVDLFQQKLPKLIKGHKYYFSVYQKMIYDIGAAALVHLILKITTPNNTYSTKIMPSFSYSNWKKWSFEFTSASDSSETNLLITSITVNSSVTEFVRDVYLDKFILIDLTDAFGENNEPSEEWCDANIREHEVIVNYGCISKHVNTSSYNKTFHIENADGIYYNYLELDSFWEPREYMLMLTGQLDKYEGYIYSKDNLDLDTTKNYYCYVDYHKKYSDNIKNQSIDFYFPVAEPSLGSQPIVENTAYNNGGGMWEWKRASAFNNRIAHSLTSDKLRVDFNNNYINNELRLTAINLHEVDSIIDVYNKNNNTSIVLADINKEWCDRWIDGRSSPIIHIKDPNNVKIDFSELGDIICNDIEIRPELNEVKFDYSTGTIYCKKLVKTQTY